MTKSFVVTLLLQLVDEGAVSLDDPVGADVDGVPNGDEVTLRDLAAMTSGLPDYSRSDEFLDALRDDLSRAFTTGELLGFAFAPDVRFEPGAEYEYSNTNTLLIGEVIEAVTDRPLPDVLSDRILEPEGLDETSYGEGTDLPSPAFVGYDVGDGAPEPIALDFSGLGIGRLDGWIGHTGEGAGYRAATFYDPDCGGVVRRW